MTFDSGRILPALRYWHPGLVKDEFPPPNRHRYVSFDVDQGGLNNIRLVFEYAAVVAAITGRTLVLPPPRPWYLINNGPRHRGANEGATDIAEIFDIPAMQEALRVQTAEGFIQEAAGHLSIPDEFRVDNVFHRDKGAADRWRQWLLDNADVPRDWNPYDRLICFPDVSSADTSSVSERYVDGRQFVELTPWLNAAPLIHLPSNSEYRFLGPVATMLLSVDDRLPRIARRLIKHHIRYHPQIFEIASDLISRLGLHQYSALHIRRNDFQYTEARAQALATWSNLKDLLADPTPTYIATDETDDAFRGVFRSNTTVVFWDDLIREYAGPAVPEKYVGPVEQLLCAGASRFVGTDLSTFSAYIVRLRGYTRAPDTAAYYHTERYSGPGAEPDPDDFKGREYLRENPMFWLDC